MNYFCEMHQKIVLVGGPSTGKTSVLNELIKRNYYCLPEVSREVIKKAKEEGIDQLFLEDPILFSNMLLEQRVKQFLQAKNSNQKRIFFDRGIPDIHAYLDYIHVDYPSLFLEKSTIHKYSKVFLFPPWKQIHITDNERYESYIEAVNIHIFLLNTYQNLGYSITQVPFGSVSNRTDFILHSLDYDV